MPRSSTALALLLTALAGSGATACSALLGADFDEKPNRAAGPADPALDSEGADGGSVDTAGSDGGTLAADGGCGVACADGAPPPPPPGKGCGIGTVLANGGCVPIDAQRIAVGQDTACAIRAGTKKLVCWGSSSFGATTPPAYAFDQVSFGSYGCGISGKYIACWGHKVENEPSTAQWKQVTVGWDYACALRDTGRPYCFGPTTSPAVTATVPSGTFVQIAAAGDTVCGVRDDGSVACWGSDANGQASPPAGTSFRQVAVSGGHACALRADGTLACWGDPQSTGVKNVPTGTFRNVVGYPDGTCAVRTNGAIACWGEALYGSLSAPTTGTYLQVSLGAANGCAIAQDGTLACWGEKATPGIPGSEPTGTFW